MIPDWQLPAGTDRGLWDYVSSTRVAREYDLALCGTPLLELDLKFVEEHLPQPGAIIDLGCGTGRLLMQLAPRGFDCVGVDLSAEMLAVLNEKSERERLKIRTLQANLVELDAIPDAQFDYAACLFSTLGMLRGQDSRERFLKHARRILKPGGIFIVHAHNALYKFGFGLGKRGTEPGDHTMPQHRGGADLTLHHFTQTELLRDLQTNGFSITECRRISVREDGHIPCPWFFGKYRAYGFLVACKAI